jgi:hypothetical protein
MRLEPSESPKEFHQCHVPSLPLAWPGSRFVEQEASEPGSHTLENERVRARLCWVPAVPVIRGIRTAEYRA